MGAIAAFDYGKWVARYPEFTTVEQNTAQAYFDEAQIYWRNDGSGPVRTVIAQQTYLNMLTAHIAAMNAVINGQASSPLVGRVTNAAEGSVNVATEFASNTPGTQAWFFTTKYGTAFWQASAAYRTMNYLPNPTVVVDGVFPYYPSTGRWS